MEDQNEFALIDGNFNTKVNMENITVSRHAITALHGV